LKTIGTLCLSVVCCLAAFAFEAHVVRGVVTDPLGAVVPRATVELLSGNRTVATSTTDEKGRYQLAAPAAGHYRVRAAAATFAPQTSPLVYAGGGSAAEVNLALNIGKVSQNVVVSATGTQTPESQVGASVSVITSDQFQNKLDVFDPLRRVPGAQVVQTGQRGNGAFLFLRGGNSDANKVLLDGVPLEDIGGQVNFGTLATTGIDQFEVLRGPNSVLYGSDALAGVVNLTTRRGTTRTPELAYAFDAGNFNSLHHDASLGGSFRQLDYLAEFSRFDTGNSVPNNSFHNGSYIGNFGWTPTSSTDVRVTARYTTAATGLPNTIQIFGIPDDSFERDQDTYISVTAQNQTTSRWHNLLRYGATRLRNQFENPSPTGLFDGFDFLGQPLTIRGANGFSTTGQAILDFGGTYPSLSSFSSKRDSIYLQSDYSFNPHFMALFGFRYENERGFTLAGTKNSTRRNNFSYTTELQGSVGRAYITAGVGIENNEIFGVAATPRVSAAYYLVRPKSQGALNGTKLKFNYGQGIKEPSVFEQTSSLFDLLSQLPNGQQLVSQFHISPIAPQRSRSFDFGVEQRAWNGRAKLGLTFFHNRFTNQIEFVSDLALQQLGVPQPVIDQTAFGANVNSADTRALGAETELEFDLGHGFSARAAYTYLDAVLERSFSSDALSPSFNPAFPTIPIGAFSPLVGDRPFRRAPHTGSFYLSYARRRWNASLSGYLVSRRNDSTFASDSFFGPTMLLPNRDLTDGYQKIDLGGSYQLSRRLTLYTTIENLADEHYDDAFGFPALPLTFRSGIKIRLGGE
jgi:iron complex outermembrane receptor protein/vitamin B12 transporter